MTGALMNLGSTALGTGHEPLPGRAGGNQNFLNEHGVDVNGHLGGVGSGALQDVEDGSRGLVGREAEDVHRFFNALAADIPRNQSGLAGGHALEFSNSFGFHYLSPYLAAGLAAAAAFFSAE